MKTHRKERMEEKKKSSFNIYKLCTILLVLILFVVLGLLLRDWYIRSRAEKQYEDLAAQVNSLQDSINSNLAPSPVSDSEQGSEAVVNVTETVEPEEDSLETLGISVPKKNLNWVEMKKVNPDIYAWIYIPGTEIDYPVLQHPSDDSYYLNYNMNGTRGYPGCIYTESVNQRDFTDFVTLIYGHNMRNDSMFATLHLFENETFFKACPYVYIYTGEKALVYEIFAAYTSGNEHIWYAYDFSADTEKQRYLDTITKTKTGDSHLRDVEVNTQSHVITLSTCIQGKPENRYLVQAVLLNEDVLEE